jgi:nicotinamide-nucleotide adenylyltransferase
MTTTRGLLIGRFQPFHRGHERLVERIAGEVDEVIVGIGSADASHTVRDPFTAGERIVMISNVLADLDLPTYVVPIEDLNRNSVWVSHAESMCPPFDVVYSNNPLVSRLFEESDYEVRDSELFDRDELRGTDIRERMIEGDGWRESLPPAVADAIDEIDGVQRIRTIAQSDVGVE